MTSAFAQGLKENDGSTGFIKHSQKSLSFANPIPLARSGLAR
jgi:hypothetical protein